MKIHNDIEQQSEEWFNLRKGRMTASHASAIGNCGKGLDTYIIELMAEYYSTAEKEHFSNEHTERGNELEDEARSLYELETGNKVTEVAFIEHDEYSGCSPDGLIESDGGLEIKCPSDKVYFKILLYMKIDSSYAWQIQMNLFISDRKWWDYVVYNPNFKKDIIIIRVYPDYDKFKKIEKGLNIGSNKIKEIKERLER